jgi:hypothetical protein
MSDQNSESVPEQTKRQRIEKKLERYRFFHNSSLGKKWVAYKEKLGATSQGRRVLKALKVLLYVGAIGLIFWIRHFSVNFFNPPDYNLTEQQIEEGYSRTWGDGRNSSEEDIYFRFYKEDEYNLPSCDTKFDWCIFAIPVYKDCLEITMQFETTKSENSSEKIEELRVSVQSKNGIPFFIGQRVTLGVESTKPDSNYGAVANIYCTM